MKNQEMHTSAEHSRRLKRRFPTLVTGLTIFTATVLLLGGKLLIFGAGANAPVTRDAQPLSGVNGEAADAADGNAGTGETQTAAVTLKDGIQYVTSSMSPGGYDPITVQQGVPVKWTLNAPSGTLNGCNSSIVIPEYNIQLKLKAGENLIEFTPDKAGSFSFSCWMGMIRSSISVTGTDGTIPPAQDDSSAGLPSGGCCAAGFAPDFANGKIPTDNIQIAEVVNGVQQATVKVDSYGYSPAVIVIERGKKFVINFNAAEINSCNSVVYFPDYGGGLDLTQNPATPELTAENDFSFECSMGMLHGYVKVVDDLNKADLDAVRQDVENFVPASGSGGGCCGRQQ